jgi:hypothetical protein
MPVESAADRAAFFNADEFGLAATYTPPGGGAGVACTILVNKADAQAAFGQDTPSAGNVELVVNADEIAAPAQGGTFAVAGGPSYEIMDRPRLGDLAGKIWIMWAV